jgi:hypothetical protein
MFIRAAITLAVVVAFTSWAAEYEVEGKIRQSIVQVNSITQEYSCDFTIYVRDCSWLIKTIDHDGNGTIWQREVGSTNGMEIYESNVRLDPAGPAKQGTENDDRTKTITSGARTSKLPGQCFISGNSIPVELLDKGVNGHLWLMFASQCYWGNLNTNWLTPVYDWHASVGANPKGKVAAEWELMGGPGSLPLQVRYLGEWGQTNGLYRVTGTNSVQGILIPSGFVFEESHVGALQSNGVIHGMTVRKRVEADVTSAKAVCSRQSLIPVLESGTVIVDWRLKEPTSVNSVPSYIMRHSGKWPSVEEAKAILKAAQQSQDSFGQIRLAQLHHTPVLVVLMCAFLLGPLGIYFVWRRSGKNAGKP